MTLKTGQNLYIIHFFTARCYAELGHATVSCLSVRLSVCLWRLGTVIT